MVLVRAKFRGGPGLFSPFGGVRSKPKLSHVLQVGLKAKGQASCRKNRLAKTLHGFAFLVPGFDDSVVRISLRAPEV